MDSLVLDKFSNIQLDVENALSSLHDLSMSIEMKIEEVKLELDLKLKEYQLQKDLLERREINMLANIQKKKKIIKFNIGGQICAILKSNLIKYEDSFFYVLLGTEIWDVGEDCTYFIDKSPKYFQYILDYLRGDDGGVISFEKLDDAQIAEIKALFEYFHLDSSCMIAWPRLIMMDDEKKRKQRTPSEDMNLLSRVPSIDRPPPPLSSSSSSQIMANKLNENIPAMPVSPSSLDIATTSSMLFGEQVKTKLIQGLLNAYRAINVVENSTSMLRMKMSQLDEMDALIRKHAEETTDVIRLDVGGKIFATLRRNLLRLEGSYFHAMLSSGTWLPDDLEQGTYFINKNPQHFEYVMEYVRTQRVSFEGVDYDVVDRILQLFEYFQLRVPHPTLCWDAHKCGPDLMLSASCMTVARSGAGMSETTAVLAAQSVTRFTVRIVSLSASTKATIGFAPRDSFDIYGKNSLNCGWYLYISTGTLISRSTYNKPYSSAIRAGTVLTVIHDTQRNEICFERDGKSLGVAFSDIPRSTLLYPAIDLCCNVPTSTPLTTSALSELEVMYDTTTPLVEDDVFTFELSFC